MKKLLYTLLAVSIIFSACKKEDEEPSAVSIGDTHQGGIIFYLNANGGGLIAAPSDLDPTQWGCYGTLIGTNSGIETGAQNTIDIEAGCTTFGTAADVCANLTLGGYSDWFLPSKDELNEIYVNLYLQELGGFTSGHYWSSTELDNNDAWNLSFGDGIQFSFNKNNSDHCYVRAIRAF